MDSVVEEPTITLEDRKLALAVGLRELADAVENPRFPDLNEINLTIDANIWDWVKNEDGSYKGYDIIPDKSLTNLRKLVRGLGGRKKEKHYGIGGFTCKRSFGEYVSVTISASRDTVCKKVPTGNKIIHAATYLPAHEEEEYEWQCDETILGAEYYGANA